MASAKPDDLEAVRTVVDTIKDFSSDEQQRIFRWVAEKLNLPQPFFNAASLDSASPSLRTKTSTAIDPHITTSPANITTNIKTFIAEKKPRNDVQFAAAVSYFYRFDAPQAERKDSINKEDLQEATRKAGRDRFANPLTTLNNAHKMGLLDKGSEKGTYTINSVGENLIAMTLPDGSPPAKVGTKKRNLSRKKVPRKAKKCEPVTPGQRTIESAIFEADSLQKVLKRQHSNQVTSTEERQVIKATAHAWFQNHRTTVTDILGSDHVKPVDELYRSLLAYAARSTLRSKYFATIKSIKKNLGALQSDHVIALGTAPKPGPALTPDTAPKFNPFIADPKMRAILTKRWQECAVCVRSNAPLAATVMMGGLLEGLLLAKINQLPDKSSVFKAAAAPIDPKTGKPHQLKEWGLKNYIDVAYELKWITKTTKDIGEVVRDYRNYIHPQKELSHGILLEASDAQMLWEVAKSITVQILKS